MTPCRTDGSGIRITEDTGWLIGEGVLDGGALKEKAKDHGALDLLNPSVIARDINLGRCRLVKGKNKLKVTILGANPSTVKKHMFGLDYILPTKQGQ